MHIFVINLPESSIRRAAIERQLVDLGLSFEVFPAIRGASLSNAEKSAVYDSKWFHRYQGRNIRPGELGCSLSHIAIYRMIVDKAIPHALVLEDDAWLNPNLPMLLRAIEEIYDSRDRNVFLLTWASSVYSSKLRNLWSSYHVAEVKSAVCTHGYVISISAARALLEALYPVAHIADAWNWIQRHGFVRVLAVIPTCITADLLFGSDIYTDRNSVKSSNSFLGMVLHKVYRGIWQVLDLIRAGFRRTGIWR